VHTSTTHKSNNDVVTVVSLLIAATVLAGFWHLVAGFTGPVVVAVMFITATLLRVGLLLVIRGSKTAKGTVGAFDVEAEVQTLAALAGVKVLSVELKHMDDPNATWRGTGNRSGHMVVSWSLAYSPHLRAVVAHELGHGYFNHHRSKLAVLQMARVVRAAPALLAFSAGFATTVAAFFAAMVVSGAFVAAHSRRLERQADRFAADLVGPGPAAELFDWFHQAGHGRNAPGVMDNVLATHPFSSQRASQLRSSR
jgi:Zn-dependent protease with chaperone function